MAYKNLKYKQNSPIFVIGNEDISIVGHCLEFHNAGYWQPMTVSQCNKD